MESLNISNRVTKQKTATAANNKSENYFSGNTVRDHTNLEEVESPSVKGRLSHTFFTFFSFFSCYIFLPFIFLSRIRISRSPNSWKKLILSHPLSQ
jgi:hypothetical protein